ncbi:MAG: trypsin-like peptidase domain-containing protein [Caldilineaceae bacterium]
MDKKTLLRTCTFIVIIMTVIAIPACWGADKQAENMQTDELASDNHSTLATTPESLTESLSSTVNEPSTAPPTFTVAVTSTPAPLSIDDVYQKLKSSTVYVYANTPNGALTGTGIIYTSNGYMVTNAHVIEKATNIRIYPEGSSSSLAAKVLGVSYCDDLAVLDIEGDGFNPATFGNSDALKRGEEVVAIGYPLSHDLGVDLVVVSGQINRLNAQIENLESAIQTDAPINPGNSGGPLANLYGEVVGINTTRINATSDGQRVTGVGFSIASNFAVPILSQLASGRSLYWTGIDFQFDRKQSRLPITGVEPNSPAESIGIIPGDLLISINKHSFQTFYEACRLLKEAGYEEQSVAFEVMRGQNKLTGEMGKHILPLSAPPVVQKVEHLPDFSEVEITKLLKQNFRVTDIGYDGANWIVVLSQNIGFSDQKIKIVEDYLELEEFLNSFIEDGYYITDLAYGDGKGVAVFSRGAGFVKQEIVSGRLFPPGQLFPKEKVDELLQEGYAITSVVSGDERWLVVMSTGSGYTGQQYELINHNDLSDKLSELSSNHQYVTLIASSNRWIGAPWFLAYTKMQTHGRQKHLITPVVSEDVIDTVIGRNSSIIDAIQALNDEWVILFR